jgi:hypothetical protein
MLKKMMLLAISVGALVAFAVPATASATDVWTDWNGLKHQTLGGGNTANQAFEGLIVFTTGLPLPVESGFGCQVTVEIRAVGPSGGKVTKFNPTTKECVGTGIYDGCTLKGDTTNIRTEEEEEFFDRWSINVSETPATVTNTIGNLTFHYIYEGCPSGVTGSHLEFASISVTPTLNVDGTITALSLSGTATNGATKISGTVTPEAGLTLGVETKN